MTAPTIDDVLAARVRIADNTLVTPVLHLPAIDQFVGAEVHLKCENMQRGGSFKLRGALNAVRELSDAEARRGVAAHSSGNHATALAIAASMRGVPCTVVMPSDVPDVKRQAVLAAGAQVVECAPTLDAREEELTNVLTRTGAIEVHPYDNPHVIAGAGTAALELHEQVPGLDMVVAPVSGGGLLSGTAITTAAVAPFCAVWGAEPTGVDDAYRSLAAGRRVRPPAAGTIADGLRAELSDRTFAILAQHLSGIVTVTDSQIVDAMAALFQQAKLVVEAAGATGVAGARELSLPPGCRVGIIVSCGNLDLNTLPFSDRMVPG